MMNLVMRSLENEFRNGDNIVTTLLEHNSNYVPWYALQNILARRGIDIELRVAGFDPLTGELDIDQLASMVDSKTKLVTTTGASNFLGYKPDLNRIGDIAHSSGYQQPRLDSFRGSYFLVDGAQLVPGTPVDVQKINCDFLAWSFHKMGLPLGVGGLYGKKEVLESMDPFLYGGDMISDVKLGKVEYNDLPWKFTAGTPNILGIAATGRGISYMINMGLGNLFIKGKISEPERIAKEGRQLVTDILMNTPRGDFEITKQLTDAENNLYDQFEEIDPDRLEVFDDANERLMATRSVVTEAMTNIMQHEEKLTQAAIDSLSKIPGVKLYGPRNAEQRSGLIAFSLEGMQHQNLAFELNRKGIEARNGTHCASLAHEALELDGTVRLSFYVYNSMDEVEKAVAAVDEIAKGR